MPGLMNQVVGAQGLIGFQGTDDPTQFIYFPTSCQAVPGADLENFECQYYGIGAKPEWRKNKDNYNALSLAGGTFSGTYKFDATSTQKTALINEIERFFRIRNPRLIPATIHEVTATPFFARGIIENKGQYEFPKFIEFGDKIKFNLGSSENNLAQLIASRNDYASTQTLPDIGIHVTGRLVLRAAPFKARVTADFNEVWNYIRSQINVDRHYGWFDLGPQLDMIAKNLVKNDLIRINFTEGRANYMYGFQMLEVIRKVLEAINEIAPPEENPIRFLPNPEPKMPADVFDTFLGSIAPYTVGVNLCYPKDFFKRAEHQDWTIDLSGEINIKVHSRINLGTACNAATEKAFYDMTLGKNDCITSQKLLALEKRIDKESYAKQKKVVDCLKRFQSGQYTERQYMTLVNKLNTMMVTEIFEG